MHAEIHAAIFDLDGTLVDSYDAHYEAWRSISATHGVAVTVDDYYSHFGRRNEDLLRECWLRAGKGELTHDEIVALDHEKEAAYRAIVANRFPIMDGAGECRAGDRGACPRRSRLRRRRHRPRCQALEARPRVLPARGRAAVDPAVALRGVRGRARRNHGREGGGHALHRHHLEGPHGRAPARG
jgi:hypothetical protein